MISIACVLSMILMLFSGCNGDAANEGTTTTKKPDETNSAKSDTEKSDESEEEAGEEEGSSTYSITGDETVTLTIFIDHPWYPVESFTGHIPEEITKRTGVILEPTIALDAQQLGVMIGSGEVPDLIYSSTLVDQLSDPDVSYSYEDLITEYGLDWEIPSKQLGIARGYSTDGTAHTVLNHYSELKDWEDAQSVPMVGSLLYRKDMWEEIGSPAINTLDDLFDVFTQIKAEYPDLGAVLKLNKDWNMSIFNSYMGMGTVSHGSSYNFLEQNDGDYLFYTRDARYKEITAWMNKCWQAGFLSPDESYFVVGSEVPPVGDFFASSSCTQNGIPGSLADHQKLDPSYVIAELVPLEGSDFTTADIGWSGTFITKSNSNPEVSIKFMQWMFTPEAQILTQMGREGIDYTLNSSGLPEFSDEWKDSLADGTHNQTFNPWFYLGGSEIVEADSRVAPTDPALVAETYAYIRDHYDNLPWVAAARPIGSSDEKVILDKVIETTKTYEARIIMAASDAEFESIFNEYQENLKTIGVEKLESYMNERIKEVLPDYK